MGILYNKNSFKMTKNEETSLRFRRSIFSIKDIKKGDVFSKENIRIIRPGYGLLPLYWEKILGKRAKLDIKRGDPLKQKLIDGRINSKILFLKGKRPEELVEWLVDRGEELIVSNDRISLEFVKKKIFVNDNKETLKSSYDILHKEMRKLFKENWDDIKNQKNEPEIQQGKGSIHYLNQMCLFEHALEEKSWNTPIKEFKEKVLLKNK